MCIPFAVVERYTYDDYGAPTVWIEDSQNPGTWIENAPNGAPVSNVGNPFMFTGRRWDEVLRLYDYRTRYYNPYLGRFLRIDTIGLWGDASNLGNPYAYVGNNPWSRLDPWGEQGPGGFLGFDANGVPIQQPSFAETLEAFKEFHRVLIDEPVRRLDPNPSPMTAAVESEILFMDRSQDVDLVAHGSNAQYTATQIVVSVVPVSWIAKIAKVKGLFGLGRAAREVDAASDVLKQTNRIQKGGIPAYANSMDDVGDAARAASRKFPTRPGGTGAAYNELTGQGVYILRDSSGTIRYVGRGDAPERLLAHAKPGSGKEDLVGEILFNNNLPAAQAQSLEQELIHMLGGPKSVNPGTSLRNKIQGIGEGNPSFLQLEFAADDHLVIEALRRAGLLGR
ncbi:MAG: hypothetical protein IT365_25080 [Candidatus Hydrogenedentes bacterium]|nr:hypothetical protein [Candidatus Hydrogenedentota bacterium]